MKNQIYKLYVEDISKLVAKIEVYLHDLPRQISGIIEYIFRCLASAESKNDETKKNEIYEITYKYEIFLINILYLTLIYTYKKIIKNYKRTFNKFNHKGIITENKTPFMKELNNLLKEGEQFLKSGKKEFSTLYKFNCFQIMFYCNKTQCFQNFFQSEINISATVNNKIKSLEKAYKIYENAINLCETNYAKIINNGYQSSFVVRTIKNIPWIVSTIITLITAIILWGNF